MAEDVHLQMILQTINAPPCLPASIEAAPEGCTPTKQVASVLLLAVVIQSTRCAVAVRALCGIWRPAEAVAAGIGKDVGTRRLAISRGNRKVKLDTYLEVRSRSPLRRSDSAGRRFRAEDFRGGVVGVSESETGCAGSISRGSEMSVLGGGRSS